MGGFEFEDAPVRRPGARHILQRQVLVDRPRVGLTGQFGEGPQQRVQLGREGQATIR